MADQPVKKASARRPWLLLGGVVAVLALAGGGRILGRGYGVELETDYGDGCSGGPAPDQPPVASEVIDALPCRPGWVGYGEQSPDGPPKFCCATPLEGGNCPVTADRCATQTSDQQGAPLCDACPSDQWMYGTQNGGFCCSVPSVGGTCAADVCALDPTKAQNVDLCPGVCPNGWKPYAGGDFCCSEEPGNGTCGGHACAWTEENQSLPRCDACPAAHFLYGTAVGGFCCSQPATGNSCDVAGGASVCALDPKRRQSAALCPSLCPLNWIPFSEGGSTSDSAKNFCCSEWSGGCIGAECALDANAADGKPLCDAMEKVNVWRRIHAAGDSAHSWHTPAYWSRGHVPTADEDVLIPPDSAAGTAPYVSAPAHARTVSMPGAHVRLVSDQNATVYGWTPDNPVLPNRLMVGTDNIWIRHHGTDPHHDWNTPAYWSRGHVPTEHEQVYIPSSELGGANPYIYSTPGYARSLRLGAGAAVMIQPNGGNSYYEFNTGDGWALSRLRLGNTNVWLPHLTAGDVWRSWYNPTYWSRGRAPLPSDAVVIPPGGDPILDKEPGLAVVDSLRLLPGASIYIDARCAPGSTHYGPVDAGFCCTGFVNHTTGNCFDGSVCALNANAAQGNPMCTWTRQTATWTAQSFPTALVVADDHTATFQGKPPHIADPHREWDDPTNWNTGRVPDERTRVLIPAGKEPVIYRQQLAREVVSHGKIWVHSSLTGGSNALWAPWTPEAPAYHKKLLVGGSVPAAIEVDAPTPPAHVATSSHAAVTEAPDPSDPVAGAGGSETIYLSFDGSTDSAKHLKLTAAGGWTAGNDEVMTSSGAVTLEIPMPASPGAPPPAPLQLTTTQEISVGPGGLEADFVGFPTTLPSPLSDLAAAGLSLPTMPPEIDVRVGSGAALLAADLEVPVVPDARRYVYASLVTPAGNEVSLLMNPTEPLVLIKASGLFPPSIPISGGGVGVSLGKKLLYTSSVDLWTGDAIQQETFPADLYVMAEKSGPSVTKSHKRFKKAEVGAEIGMVGEIFVDLGPTGLTGFFTGTPSFNKLGVNGSASVALTASTPVLNFEWELDLGNGSLLIDRDVPGPVPLVAFAGEMTRPNALELLRRLRVSGLVDLGSGQPKRFAGFLDGTGWGLEIPVEHFGISKSLRVKVVTGADPTIEICIFERGSVQLPGAARTLLPTIPQSGCLDLNRTTAESAARFFEQQGAAALATARFLVQALEVPLGQAMIALSNAFGDASLAVQAVSATLAGSAEQKTKVLQEAFQREAEALGDAVAALQGEGLAGAAKVTGDAKTVIDGALACQCGNGKCEPASVCLESAVTCSTDCH